MGVGVLLILLVCDLDIGELVMLNFEFFFCSCCFFIGYDFFFKYGYKDIFFYGCVIIEQGIFVFVFCVYKCVIVNFMLKNLFVIQQY